MARSSLLSLLQEWSGHATDCPTRRQRGRVRTTDAPGPWQRRKSRTGKGTGKSALHDGCFNGAGAGPAPANESDPQASGISRPAPMKRPNAVLSRAGNPSAGRQEDCPPHLSISLSFQSATLAALQHRKRLQRPPHSIIMNYCGLIASQGDAVAAFAVMVFPSIPRQEARCVSSGRRCTWKWQTGCAR